jgi:hypothetical protein
MATTARFLLVSYAVAGLLYSSPSDAGGSGTQLSVRCIVPARVDLQAEQHPATLNVTADDIARGYLDVTSGSHVSVASNAPSGYAIDFHPQLAIFKSVALRTPAGAGVIGADGGTLVQRSHGARAHRTEIAYRFELAEHLAPGIYPWPLAMSARPL